MRSSLHPQPRTWGSVQHSQLTINASQQLSSIPIDVSNVTPLRAYTLGIQQERKHQQQNGDLQRLHPLPRPPSCRTRQFRWWVLIFASVSPFHHRKNDTVRIPTTTTTRKKNVTNTPIYLVLRVRYRTSSIGGPPPLQSKKSAFSPVSGAVSGTNHSNSECFGSKKRLAAVKMGTPHHRTEQQCIRSAGRAWWQAAEAAVYPICDVASFMCHTGAGRAS